MDKRLLYKNYFQKSYLETVFDFEFSCTRDVILNSNNVVQKRFYGKRGKNFEKQNSYQSKQFY